MQLRSARVTCSGTRDDTANQLQGRHGDGTLRAGFGLVRFHGCDARPPHRRGNDPAGMFMQAPTTVQSITCNQSSRSAVRTASAGQDSPSNRNVQALLQECLMRSSAPQSVLHIPQANAEVNAGGEARPPSRPESASVGGAGLPEALQGGHARPEGVIDIRVDAGRGSDDGHLSVGSTPSSIQVGCQLQASQNPFSIATATYHRRCLHHCRHRVHYCHMCRRQLQHLTFASGHQQTAAFQHLSSRCVPT